MTAARRLAAILAADVVGYSRLMGQDEAGTARLCCKDDRRRWEDGDKLDPISFMRRYRKERQ